MSTENIINGVSIECIDEALDKPAKVIIRDPAGKVVATVIASLQQRCIEEQRELLIVFEQAKR